MGYELVAHKQVARGVDVVHTRYRAPMKPLAIAGAASAFILGTAAVVVVATFPLIGRNQVSEASIRMRILEEGLDRWANDFNEGRMPTKLDYPPLNGFQPAAMTDGEFLRFTLFPSDEELSGYWAICPVTHRTVDRAVFDHGEIQHMLDPDDAMSFVDPWNQDYMYQYPGEDHELRGHKNKDGNDASVNHGSSGRPDIWSIGANANNDKPNWATVPNQTDTNDDITNWFSYR